mmetsp:Transcript_25731/g.56749  ORF Transcript_25731/g.56749 Transcript_25731/m.56749 type:complete len:271 (-) Transcript_25731:624-1436(-)
MACRGNAQAAWRRCLLGMAALMLQRRSSLRTSKKAGPERSTKPRAQSGNFRAPNRTRPAWPRPAAGRLSFPGCSAFCSKVLAATIKTRTRAKKDWRRIQDCCRIGPSECSMRNRPRTWGTFSYLVNALHSRWRVRMSSGLKLRRTSLLRTTRMRTVAACMWTDFWRRRAPASLTPWGSGMRINFPQRPRTRRCHCLLGESRAALVRSPRGVRGVRGLCRGCRMVSPGCTCSARPWLHSRSPTRSFPLRTPSRSRQRRSLLRLGSPARAWS